MEDKLFNWNKYDRDVYDSPPEGKNLKEYKRGYLTIVYCAFKSSHMEKMRKLIRKCNTWAIITSNYQASDESASAYVCLFVIHKEIQEKWVFDEKVGKVLRDCLIKIDRYKERKVWFHEHFLLPTYEVKTYKTPGYKYAAFANSFADAELRKKNLKKMQRFKRTCMIEQGCYIQREKGSILCKGYTDGRNHFFCRQCVLCPSYKERSQRKKKPGTGSPKKDEK